jgi:hypothetical protein
MECLIDWIGLKGCTVTTPDSGIYVNDLPGVNLKKIDSAADDQQVNFTGVWTDVQKRAAKRFRIDTIAALGSMYRIKRTVRSINISKEVDTTTTRAAAAEYRGLTLELNEANCEYVDYNLQVIHVQEIKFYSAATEATTDILVYDLDTGLLLDTVASGALVVGWNTINFEKKYWDSRRIFIGIDSASINSVNLDLGNVYDDYDNCCEGEVKGAYAASATPTTITQSSDSYGMAAIMNVRCSYDALVCQNKDLFAYSWLYCLGSELMSELMFTDRLNRWTTVNAKDIANLKQYFEVQYRGGTFGEIEYDGYLPTAVSGVYLNESDCCIECDADYRFTDGI